MQPKPRDEYRLVSILHVAIRGPDVLYENIFYQFSIQFPVVKGPQEGHWGSKVLPTARAD